MHVETSYLDRARETLSESGGWLLHMGDGNYLVTDDEGTVRGLRGNDYVSDCERLQCWDETA